VVSVYRSRLKGEVPRFSADFTHFSSKRPFRFPTHLIRPLGIDNVIAILDITIHSAIFKLTRTWTKTRKSTDKDLDLDTLFIFGMELEYFFLISIQCYSRYSAIWITCDISRRKFQQLYKLIAPLPDVNYDMQIFKNSYRCWNCSLNGCVSWKWKYQHRIFKNAATKICTVLGNH
jgi:hypothetical protein